VKQSCISGQIGCFGDSQYSHYLGEQVQECAPSSVDTMRLLFKDDDGGGGGGDFSGSEQVEPEPLEHRMSNWVVLAVGLSFGMLMLVMSAVGVAERNLYFEKASYANDVEELQQLNELTATITDERL